MSDETYFSNLRTRVNPFFHPDPNLSDAGMIVLQAIDLFVNREGKVRPEYYREDFDYLAQQARPDDAEALRLVREGMRNLVDCQYLSFWVGIKSPMRWMPVDKLLRRYVR